jgi:hypothetical protein
VHDLGAAAIQVLGTFGFRMTAECSIDRGNSVEEPECAGGGERRRTIT